MKSRLSRHWKRVPIGIRRPIALVVGFTLILAAGAIGWLPGPGGIPVFLLGIFVLASEFKWADDFGLLIMKLVHDIGRWLRQHPILGTAMILCSLTLSTSITYMLFIRK